MAEQNTGQERTEQPTEKRLRDARAKGQIPRSRELNTVVMLLASVAGLMIFGESMSHSMRELVSLDLSLDRNQVFDKSAIIMALQTNVIASLKMLMPFFVLMMIAVFAGPLMMGGWSFSAKSMAPKFSKLNPASGFKRMFGIQGLIELLKALLKFSLIGVSAVILLQSLSERYLTLGQTPLLSGVASGMDLLGQVYLILSLTLLLVAGVDIPYQKWNHMRKLKMTRQEIKEENKESNGNPELKSRIRSMQFQMSNRRMMQEVPTADVVIVNPTHFSVALRYEHLQGAAPKVVAKGVDHMALKIREIANQHDVPLFEAPPLARALYHHCELDREIPEELYMAVAQVLAYIYQLKQQAAGRGQTPQKPVDLPVPDEFLRNG
ncbi:MAG: flagellar type III secretion system protein FlhB [Gammaproteobacteria bacterium]|nr:flagellar type III secretion system protein FlhB [Gammaproteobacteria bacterium]